MRRGFEIFEWFFTIADINDQIRPFVCVLYLEHDNPVHLRSADRVKREAISFGQTDWILQTRLNVLLRYQKS